MGPIGTNSQNGTAQKSSANFTRVIFFLKIILDLDYLFSIINLEIIDLGVKIKQEILLE